jgi:hypothetical protein
MIARFTGHTIELAWWIVGTLLLIVAFLTWGFASQAWAHPSCAAPVEDPSGFFIGSIHRATWTICWPATWVSDNWSLYQVGNGVAYNMGYALVYLTGLIAAFLSGLIDALEKRQGL